MTGAVPFATLSERGRHLRLRRAARAALNAHGLAAELTFVTESFNSIFRAVTPSGSRLALRVSPEIRIHARRTEAAEARWMTELRAGSDLPIPAVHPDRTGEVVTEVQVADVPGRRTCMVFDWVVGQPLRDAPTPSAMAAAGRLMALLHEAGAAERTDGAPAGVLVADRVLQFEDQDRMGSAKSATARSSTTRGPRPRRPSKGYGAARHILRTSCTVTSPGAISSCGATGR